VSLAAYARARPGQAPGADAPEAEEVRQYLSFQLDGYIYAVPLAQVAEITPFKELNRIPHMPRSVEGLLNHRGQVIPVISLRARMNLAPQEACLSRNIVVLNLGGPSQVGILVDAVDAVVSAAPEHRIPASPLLAGPEGAWVPGFILQGDRIITLLDTGFITALHGARAQLQSTQALDRGQALDRELQALIDLSPPKAEAGRTRIIPQMEEAIAHTEQEMAKVIGCVESMLAGSGKSFQALARLKQEAALGRLKGEETALAELEKTGTQLQDRIFALFQQLQFQDIARQKLERVLNHIRGLQQVVGVKLRDAAKS
jgi:purine-binding chemotaxis protein CheW